MCMEKAQKALKFPFGYKPITLSFSWKMFKYG